MTRVSYLCSFYTENGYCDAPAEWRVSVQRLPVRQAIPFGSVESPLISVEGYDLCVEHATALCLESGALIWRHKEVPDAART